VSEGTHCQKDKRARKRNWYRLSTRKMSWMSFSINMY